MPFNEEWRNVLVKLKSTIEMSYQNEAFRDVNKLIAAKEAFELFVMGHKSILEGNESAKQLVEAYNKILVKDAHSQSMSPEEITQRTGVLLNKLDIAIKESAIAERENDGNMFIHSRIISIFGALAFFCIAGGVMAIYWNSMSDSAIYIFGAKISTGHVGVAFVAIGLLTALFAVREVLRNQRELAQLSRGK